ncbi:hypothetical protein K503DRAFT_771492 [Rhizopogon vinicolor AM-OR11-026]|uniref:Uncharacterized protein n=1 Tax=Rhizopogon vinicolor AM-OR11-026 TaxID=1314800 RepID=A0A1B7MXX8_9AGAM|nr:hypothetical protein K503DRAFT_771492 [Rhizopogon vinicolor AM-OR11-026]
MLIHMRHCSLTPAVPLPCAVIQQRHLPYLAPLTFQLQETRSNIFSFATSVNSFASCPLPMQFLLFQTGSFMIH